MKMILLSFELLANSKYLISMFVCALNKTMINIRCVFCNSQYTMSMTSYKYPSAVLRE